MYIYIYARDHKANTSECCQGLFCLLTKMCTTAEAEDKAAGFHFMEDILGRIRGSYSSSGCIEYKWCTINIYT